MQFSSYIVRTILPFNVPLILFIAFHMYPMQCSSYALYSVPHASYVVFLLCSLQFHVYPMQCSSYALCCCSCLVLIEVPLYFQLSCSLFQVFPLKFFSVGLFPVFHLSPLLEFSCTLELLYNKTIITFQYCQVTYGANIIRH